MILSTITAAAALPVSVAEAKAHSYITHDDDDLMIERFVGTATAMVETMAGVALCTQTLEARFVEWPTAGVMELPRYPLASVTSVKYTDSSGTENTFATDRYWVNAASEPGQIWLDYGCSWPTATLRPGPSIAVRYVAGYGAAADVPDALKSAVLLFFADLYEHRERTVLQPGVTKATVDQAMMLIHQARRW
jgi:uncharacterized phiE125 gp8 family phage protein